MRAQKAQIASLREAMISTEGTTTAGTRIYELQAAGRSMSIPRERRWISPS